MNLKNIYITEIFRATENLIKGGTPLYFSFQPNFEIRVKLCIDLQSLSLGSGWAANLLALAE